MFFCNMNRMVKAMVWEGGKRDLYSDLLNMHICEDNLISKPSNFSFFEFQGIVANVIPNSYVQNWENWDLGNRFCLFAALVLGKMWSDSFNACLEPICGATSIFRNSSLQISWSGGWYHMKAGPGPAIIAMRHLVTLRHSYFYLCLFFPPSHWNCVKAQHSGVFITKSWCQTLQGTMVSSTRPGLSFLSDYKGKECARNVYIFCSQEWTNIISWITQF